MGYIISINKSYIGTYASIKETFLYDDIIIESGSAEVSGDKIILCNGKDRVVELDYIAMAMLFMSEKRMAPELEFSSVDSYIKYELNNSAVLISKLMITEMFDNNILDISKFRDFRLRKVSNHAYIYKLVYNLIYKDLSYGKSDIDISLSKRFIENSKYSILNVKCWYEGYRFRISTRILNILSRNDVVLTIGYYKNHNYDIFNMFDRHVMLLNKIYSIL